MLAIGRSLGVALVALFLAGSARADIIGFTVYFTGSSISLENDAALAEITAYSISIGDPAFNFDSASTAFTIGSPGSAFVLVSPDTADDGARSDDLSYTFENFMPGDLLGSAVDIDPDTGNSACCNIHGVMFNNGAAPNATIAVTFSNEFVLDAEIPDTAELACSEFGQCQFSLSFDVPEPGLALLLAGGVALLVAGRRGNRA